MPSATRTHALVFLSGVCTTLFVLAWVGAAPTPVHPQEEAVEDTMPEGPRSDELAEIYRSDQDVRKSDWSKLSPEEMGEIRRGDRERRERVLEILAANEVVTPKDHFYVAMVLQHGEEPDDYLLAHVLATVAAFDDVPAAKWLSAATLDRYLQNIERPQIFGTQFLKKGEQWSLEPLTELFGDAVRKAYKVPSLAVARSQVERMNSRK